jgi:hypothetical protein
VKFRFWILLALALVCSSCAENRQKLEGKTLAGSENGVFTAGVDFINVQKKERMFVFVSAPDFFWIAFSVNPAYLYWEDNYLWIDDLDVAPRVLKVELEGQKVTEVDPCKVPNPTTSVLAERKRDYCKNAHVFRSTLSLHKVL